MGGGSMWRWAECWPFNRTLPCLLYALLHNAHTTTRTKNLAHNVS
uniref:Uncharacterized protein n=1 Tax=Anguilla anguilla TaxID=7936 RepID=A0A0E9V5H1_ANGAN